MIQQTALNLKKTQKDFCEFVGEFSEQEKQSVLDLFAKSQQPSTVDSSLNHWRICAYASKPGKALKYSAFWGSQEKVKPKSFDAMLKELERFCLPR